MLSHGNSCHQVRFRMRHPMRDHPAVTVVPSRRHPLPGQEY
ncbi:hypothetical protein F750_0426 [Streptomyces sp. PAMC 26508]|nr:hypothetical protein F750_0426 [Streptomyces sp. PAMC 26508]